MAIPTSKFFTDTRNDIISTIGISKEHDLWVTTRSNNYLTADEIEHLRQDVQKRYAIEPPVPKVALLPSTKLLLLCEDI